MKPAEMLSESGGHPSYDQVYEKIIRAQLQASALDDPFLQELVKRFRQGPMMLCSRSIGLWINKRLRQANWSQQDLADRLGIDRSAVAYWIKGGNINLVNLAQVLLEFQSDWTELPIPARRELAVAAYLAALTFARERLDPLNARVLDHERFWGLFHLFSEPYWERAIRRQDPDLLRQEAARIIQAVRVSLGQAPVHLVSVESLKLLVSEWGVPWLICIGQVPRKWAIQ